MILRSARLADGRVVDVRLADGSIAEIGEVGKVDGPVLELEGRVLLPGLVEPHLHLDSAFSCERSPAGDPGLDSAIASWLEARAKLDGAEIHRRGERALATAVRYGVTAMRAHVDVGEGIELRALEASRSLREEWRDVIDLELVAMADVQLTGEQGAGARGWLEAALEEGADVVGGAPGLDTDPAGCVELLLQLAAAAARPIDLHVDETLDPAANVLEAFALAVQATGFDRPATAGHCASLGMRTEAEQRELAALVAGAGLTVVALPATNLYLLGRGHASARPRGITAIAALQAAGVVVAAGSDNIRDAFNPVGAPDPLRTASLLVIAAQTSTEAALRAVTGDARRVLSRPAVELRTGSPADLVAVPGATIEEALAEASEDRIVIKSGRIVAQTSIIEAVSPRAGLQEPLSA